MPRNKFLHGNFDYVLGNSPSKEIEIYRDNENRSMLSLNLGTPVEVELTKDGKFDIFGEETVVNGRILYLPDFLEKSSPPQSTFQIYESSHEGVRSLGPNLESTGRVRDFVERGYSEDGKIFRFRMKDDMTIKGPIFHNRNFLLGNLLENAMRKGLIYRVSFVRREPPDAVIFHDSFFIKGHEDLEKLKDRIIEIYSDENFLLRYFD